MIYGNKEYEKSMIQRNRDDYEAIILRRENVQQFSFMIFQ